LVNYLVLSQEDTPQTHRTVREISRETQTFGQNVTKLPPRVWYFSFYWKNATKLNISVSRGVVTTHLGVVGTG